MATAAADVDRLLCRLASADFGCFEPPWNTDEGVALVRTLSRLQDVLTSVEKKQSFECTKVQDWMRKIKQMAYQIEDILDEFEDRSIPSGRSGWRKAIFFCSSSHFLLHSTMSHRMKTIRRKLDCAAKDSLIFSLLEQTTSDFEQSNKQVVFDGNAIVGRENEKHHIQNLLQNDVETLSIIPIVGLRGLGKTTLARLIFEDKRNGWNFDLRIWVHLNRNLDLNNIASDIISQANKTEEIVSEINTNDQIQENLQSMKNRLREVLHDKSCLIVLDGMWSTDKSQLGELKEMLRGTQKCTKVIVTTCSEKTAEIMHSIPSYKLSSLSENDCWIIFSQRAFGNGDEACNSCLTEIGKEIVKRCEGIPILAHSLGSMVQNHDMNIWLAAKEEEIWKLENKFSPGVEVFPSLKQIYYDMPLSLRTCFVYLSSFPKGSCIDKEKLIREWTALDMLASKYGTLPAYVQGEIYIHDLLSISFLETPKTPSVTGMNHTNDPLVLNMHNLVHDFARFVAFDDLIVFNGGVQSVREGKLAFRYALLTNYNGQSTLNKGLLTKTRALRFRNFKSVKILRELFSILKHLRVLDLSGCCIAELPSSIGQLKYLRYLDMSNLSISALPDQMSSLQNLEVVDLSKTSLVVLPLFIGNFQKLKYLNLQRCNKLQSLPPALGELTMLEYLNMSSCSGVGELPESLHGLHELRVLDLSSCTELQQLPQLFGNLTNLEDLNLSTCSKLKQLPESFGDLSSLRLLRLSSYSELQQFQDSLTNLINLDVLIPSDPVIALSEPKHYLGIDKEPYAACDESKISNLAGDRSLQTVESCSELQQFAEPYQKLLNLYARRKPLDPGIAVSVPERSIDTWKRLYATLNDSEITYQTGDVSLHTEERENLDQIPELQSFGDYRLMHEVTQDIPKVVQLQPPRKVYPPNLSVGRPWGRRRAKGAETERHQIRVRVSVSSGLKNLYDDGYSWWKYGQKDILGDKYPRSYYRCRRQGCTAKKHEQHTSDDPDLLDVVYSGRHTCIDNASSLPDQTAEKQAMSFLPSQSSSLTVQNEALAMEDWNSMKTNFSSELELSSYFSPEDDPFCSTPSLPDNSPVEGR